MKYSWNCFCLFWFYYTDFKFLRIFRWVNWFQESVPVNVEQLWKLLIGIRLLQWRIWKLTSCIELELQKKSFVKKFSSPWNGIWKERQHYCLSEKKNCIYNFFLRLLSGHFDSNVVFDMIINVPFTYSFTNIMLHFISWNYLLKEICTYIKVLTFWKNSWNRYT